MPRLDPSAIYRSRLAIRRTTLERLQRDDARAAASRLGVFALAIVVGVLGWRGDASLWWLAGPVAGFIALAVWHDGVLGRLANTRAAIDACEHGLARTEDRWTDWGSHGERFTDDRHPYCADLDLFGPASMFQLLSVARSDAGEATLAAWLKEAATPQEIAARQGAAQELAQDIDLREDVIVAGASIRRRVEGESLERWASLPSTLSPRLRVAAACITLATLAAATFAVATNTSAPLLVMLGIQAGFALPLERRVRAALHGADGPARSLTALSRVVRRLEDASFTSERLVALRIRLDSHNVKASVAVSRLNRLVEMHDWQHNVVFAPIGLFLMWGTHLALAVEAWRRRHGVAVATWIDAVGEFEALSSLATYAFEHPADPYPVIEQVTGQHGSACFVASDLGHPLLPAARAVRNDVTLDAGRRLLLISGSNMSGKSTLLRTVGVGAVMAQMGAPVRAASLTMTPLRVGATLRIQDSLQEGRSRFYAEISRVRELVDASKGPVALMFLLDELFHGTNSHDRLAGATGVLRTLLGNGALGLVTTHDLALTSMAAELGASAVNVHFEDWFEAGEMRFDYRMKPGPVTRSNALALMRAVGLTVDEPA